MKVDSTLRNIEDARYLARRFAIGSPAKLGKVDMLALVVWGCLVAWTLLLVLSFIMEHNSWSIESISHISWLAIGAIGYNVYPVTLLGFAVWSRLLSHYPAATVAPLTLLVPIFGFTASILVLGEPLSQ